MSKFELFPNALPIDAKEIGGGSTPAPALASTFDILLDPSSFEPAEDVTFNQIKEAVLNGLQVRLIYQTGSMEGDGAFNINFVPFYSMYNDGSAYSVSFFNFDRNSDYHGIINYEAESADTPLDAPLPQPGGGFPSVG